MKELAELESRLLEQDFIPQQENCVLEQYKQTAAMYAQIENSIAVLSNLKDRKSYIYNGALGEVLDLYPKNAAKEINSIWEEDIYNRIHPDDIVARHAFELKFFHLLKKIPIRQRIHFRTHSFLRMANSKGEYLSVLHRTFYLCNQSNGTLWLALCLYNFAPISESVLSFEGIIQNSLTGELLKESNDTVPEIISYREKEVLNLIAQGMPSKQIAIKLAISKNTVDRHRQNIMEKLRVGNSMEAIKVAHELNII